MAILDTGSIVLLVLAVLIAPIVLPILIRFMRGASGPVSRWFE